MGRRVPVQTAQEKKGEDLIIPVPLGTIVSLSETGELIGDLNKPDQKLLIAKGGFHGLGNTRFKSSKNRTPRQTTPGKEGESREIKLELSLLADVGLLGLPNAGKSTLVNKVSAAKPKIADYPFTTMIPSLGVVNIGNDRSFVIADIPGVIKGAAEGAGLGIRFLKHLTRTKLVLHIVDVSPMDKTPPKEAFREIELELEKFSPTLARQSRWLILNKADLFDVNEHKKLLKNFVKDVGWIGPSFLISAATGQGVDLLCNSVGDYLNDERSREINDSEAKKNADKVRNAIFMEAKMQISKLAESKRKTRKIKDSKIEEDVTTFYGIVFDGSRSNKKVSRIVIKLGSSILTNDGTGLDQNFINSICHQVSQMQDLGKEIVIVSSGAIAEGMLRLD